MIRTLSTAALGTLALSLAACGSNENTDETVGTEYDAEAPSLEDVATDAEMEALEAQEDALEEEAAAPETSGIDTSEVTSDNAETEEIVGM